MPSDCITFQESGYFSKLIVDYLNQKKEIQTLYNRFSSLSEFGAQIAEKKQNFSGDRATLVQALQKQYKGITVSKSTQNNIESLLSENAFTITTGHQLSLFTGPLYFIYKIVSAIKTTEVLKEQYPEFNFVPVYWMATEDHDFDEINHFFLNGKKISWNREASGSVGRLSTEGLDNVFAILELELGIGTNAKQMKELFRKSYLEHQNLAIATRYLVNELFKDYGLVIVDGDDKELKKQMIPYFKDELLHQKSFYAVQEILPFFEKENYKIQVNPREINLFYIEDAIRERIVKIADHYEVLNTKLSFSEEEILNELETNPEKFSPNVILRPLYQEVILPNLCYIGGGGEIAYWLELKNMFEQFNVTFPVLYVRNSAVAVTEKQLQKMDKLELNWSDLFQKRNELVNNKTKEFADFPLDFSGLKEQLSLQFEKLYEVASKTDISFLNAVKAQEQKQLKGLLNLEKKLLRAEKIKQKDKLERILELKNSLFPNESLQERVLNISELSNEINTNSFINNSKEEFNCFINNFSILKL